MIGYATIEMEIILNNDKKITKNVIYLYYEMFMQ